MAEHDAVLLPFQQRWINDPAPVKVCEKSRQIGLTWAEAADDVLIAAQAGGRDVWYIGYEKEMTREFIETAADWARRFDRAASAIEEFLFEDDDERQIQAFRIKFASGNTITALSSRPRNLRGKHGVVVIDEAAFHDDLPALLTAALALLMWGGSVRIISTHDGVSNAFNELVNDVRGGKLPYSLHRITFDDAVTEGLYRRICEATGQTWTAQREDGWRAQIRAQYGDHAGEELDCVPATKSGAWLPYSLIISCEHPEAGKREGYLGGWCFVGNDIGRRRDLWVAWVLELVGDVLWTREIRELKGATFAEQDAVMDELMGAYRVLRLSMDQTGMGEKPVEDARRRYPGRVDGVLLTPPVRINLATIGKEAMEGLKVRIPAERPELRADLNKPRMEAGPTGASRLVVERDQDGHADRFWALVLALGGADTKHPPAQIFLGDDEDLREEAA